MRLAVFAASLLWYPKGRMRLDVADLACHLQGLGTLWQADVGLLLSIRTDQGVDLEGADAVHGLCCRLDLVLVGPHIAQEDQGVVILHLAHGCLRVQGGLDDGVVVEVRNRRNRATSILWTAGQLQGLWTVEGGRGADLAGAMGVDALQGSLGGSGGLPRSSRFGINGLFIYAFGY